MLAATVELPTISAKVRCLALKELLEGARRNNVKFLVYLNLPETQPGDAMEVSIYQSRPSMWKLLCSVLLLKLL